MILITGGLGYLGKITSYLLALGYKVRLASSRSNPEIPENLSSCQVVKIDLQELKSLESSCEGVAGIIHLAALDASGSQGHQRSVIN